MSAFLPPRKLYLELLLLRPTEPARGVPRGLGLPPAGACERLGVATLVDMEADEMPWLRMSSRKSALRVAKEGAFGMVHALSTSMQHAFPEYCQHGASPTLTRRG